MSIKGIREHLINVDHLIPKANYYRDDQINGLHEWAHTWQPTDHEHNPTKKKWK